MIGSVPAGSAFAVLQSAGAGGAGLGTVAGAVKGTGLAIAGASVAAAGMDKYLSHQGSGSEEDKDQEAENP